MDWKVTFNGTLCVTALVYGAFLGVARSAGLFGLWLLVLLMLSLWRYAYSVLRYVAQGRIHVPAPDLDSMNPVGEFMLLWHFVAFPAVYALFVAVAPFGSDGTGLALNSVGAAIFVIAFPASAALMGISGDIATALNPVAIRSVIAAMEHDYYVLVAVCAGLVALMVWTSDTTFLAGLPLSIVQTWAGLSIFALIGSSIHRHAADFDVPGARLTLEERQDTDRARRWRSELDLAYASIRGGLVAEGFDVIKKLVDDNNRSREVQFWLFEQMMRWEEHSHALRVATRLAVQLISENDLATAFELYMRCRRAGGLTLGAAANARLAVFADSVGQAAIAAELRSARDP